MGIRTRLLAVFIALTLVSGCGGAGGGDLQSRHDELAKRVTKLEDDLHEARKQLIAQKEALRILNGRMKELEASVDKLAYGSSIRR